MKINSKKLVELILNEWDVIDFTLIESKRNDVEYWYRDAIESLSVNIPNIIEELAYLPEKSLASSLSRHTQELAGFLYVIGRPKEEWQKWNSIAALALFFAGDYMFAMHYAILGGEFELLKMLPDKKPDTLQLEELIPWDIIKGTNYAKLNVKEDSEWDEAWKNIQLKIKYRDFENILDHFDMLITLYMEWTDWSTYEYLMHPVFPIGICSSLALTRELGGMLDFQTLSEEKKLLLEPGIVEITRNNFFRWVIEL
ncbi:MAG: hypothetical protein H6566_13620 [Lewinellaceae bacterium]|nr:hypothetical protein [Lewinellaceae bacterium]